MKCEWCGRDDNGINDVTVNWRLWRVCDKCKRDGQRVFVVVDLVSNVHDDDLADYRAHYPDLTIPLDAYIDVVGNIVDCPNDYSHTMMITIYSCAMASLETVPALVGHDGTLYVHFEHFC